MSAVNLNDTPLHLHEWAELDHIAALERHAAAKLTRADLDDADIRRQAREQHVTHLVAASVAARTAPQTPALLRLLRRIRRSAHAAYVQWTINSHEQWVTRAERELIVVRRELEALRCELAMAERGRP